MKNTEIENTVIPDGEAESKVAAEKETIPNEAEKIFVPVKFNKEIRNLELGEAAALAQKGLKFDAIAKDYESLKRIAAQNGNSISGSAVWGLLSSFFGLKCFTSSNAYRIASHK